MDGYGMDDECSCMLRVLESDAFSAIVSAFRAQGMLNEYKRVVLEHVKRALFISDERYHAEIQQAANDQLLSKIAQTLNPSYDTYAEWGLEGLHPAVSLSADDKQIPPVDDDGNGSDMKGTIANELLQLAKRHNASLSNRNAALHEMIALPEAPYVPERLRLLLHETENDYEGRIDVLPCGEEETSHRRRRRRCSVASRSAAASNTETLSTSTVQQSLKTAESTEGSYVVDSTQKTFYHDVVATTSTTRPNSLEFATSCPSSSSGSTPVIAAVDQTAFMPQLASQVSGDDDFDSQAVADHVRPKRRRLRQRDPSATCARVLPFRFQSPAPGQKNKPVRGNPDRRPSRQTTPPGISNFTSISSHPSTPSVTSAHPSHMTTTLPAYRAIPTNSTAAISSGRLHQVSHLTTSGMVMKRARTMSSGGGETTILDGSSAFPRQLTSAQNVFRIQQPVQRAYIRSSSGQRFFASPMVSAYSNPARPYYGNPNAVVGFMRSLSTGAPRSSYTISSAPSTSSACHSQPQTITSSEIQRLIAQAAASGQPQQYRTVRRPPPRPVVLSSSPRLSVASHRQGLSSAAAPFINLGGLTSSNPGNLQLQQQQQLDIQPALRVTHRTLPLPAAANRAHSALATTLANNIPLVPDVRLQHIGSGDLQLQQSDPDTIAAVNSITQDSDETMEQERGTEMDGSMLAMNPDEHSSEVVRLECDEVLLPESRCILSNYSNNSANLQVAHHQQRSGNEEVSMIVGYRGENQNVNHTSHLVPQQYSNGLIHQDGQNVISYVTAPQCTQ